MKSYTYFKLLWVVFFFSVTQVFGQDDWQFDTHSNNITGISIAGEEVWVATRDGIFKFNSATKESTKFSALSTNLTDDYMTGIMVTPDDSVWVSYYYFGAGHASMNAQNWVNYERDSSPLESNFVRTMTYSPSGSVYLGTYYGGISIYKDGAWTSLTSPLPISNSSGGIIQIAFDINNGNDIDAWFGTKKHGLYHRKADSTWVYYDIYNSALPGNMVSGLAVDFNSRAWAGSHGGLAVVDGDSVAVFTHTNSPIPNNYVQDVAIGLDSVVWVATKQGLVRIPTQSYDDFDTWEVFTEDNSGLPSSWLEQVEVDTLTGDLWIGTYSKGLVKYDGITWEVFDFNDSSILDNDVLSLNYSIRDSTLMVSTRTSGLGLLQDSVWTIIDAEHHGLPTNQVNYAEKDTFGHVWIAYSFDGLTKWDGVTATHYDKSNSPLKPPYNVINDLYITPENILWLAVNGGLWEFNHVDSIWTFHHADTTEKYRKVRSIESDGNNGFWYAGDSLSLMHFDGVNLKSYNTPDDFLYDVHVTDLELDEWGNVWIGTFGSGLLKKDTLDNWQLFNPVNSALKGALVSSLQYTPDSTLWVGTTGAGLYSYKLGPWNHFGVYLGHLPQNNVADLAWDGRNTLWIGMTHLGLGKHHVNVYTRPEDTLFVEPDETANAINPFSGKMTVYPNPIQDIAHIDLSIPKGGQALISIFDTEGRLVQEILPGFLPVGDHIIDLNLSGFPSGNYYLQLFINGERGSQVLHVL